jgi:hypothetical protein
MVKDTKETPTQGDQMSLRKIPQIVPQPFFVN